MIDVIDQAGSNFDPLNPPELPLARQKVYEYYQLALDQDGCPKKRMDDGRMVFHPILIPYLVVDHFNQYKENGSMAHRDYAAFIMRCAIPYADPDRKELVFNYFPEDGLSSIPVRFYSGLTQSWYIRAFSVLEENFPGEFKECLKRTFQSLLVPIDEGGVLLKKDYGWIVEEYPHDPPLYTLNGWLTAIRMVLSASRTLRDAGVDYEEFVEKNLDAVAELLPLYDAEFCSNSRYQLTGFTRLKFVFDRAVNYSWHSMSVRVSGERDIEASAEIPVKRNRWNSYLERSEPRLIQFSVLLSMISFPVPPEYAISINADQKCTLRVFVADGDYSPMLSAMPTERWREVGIHTLVEGQNKVEGEIHYDDKNLFAYPTNFKKKIDGKYFNAYHIIHIVDLAILYKHSRREIFADTARKWLGYMDAWDAMEMLSDPDISKRALLYGDGLPELIERYLE